MRRRALLTTAAAGATGLLAGCSFGDGGEGGGGPAVADTDGEAGTPPTDDGRMRLTSSAFGDGARIPSQHGCDGIGLSPPLSVGGLPDGTETLALIADDPDAPTGEPFVHWLVWNVPVTLRTWPGGVTPNERATDLDGAPQGTNSGGGLGYFPACPPKDDGPHRYRFTMVAVDDRLPLDPGAERAALESALDGRTLARARLVGTYERD